MALKKWKDRWSQLSIRDQFRFLFLFSLFAFSILFLLMTWFSVRSSLLERSFQLLQITQKSSLEKINAISPPYNFKELKHLFIDRTGLGESGETYLVDLQGNLLTASRFTLHPNQAPLPESFILDLAQSNWMGIKQDYRDIPVLAVWNHLKVNNSDSIFLASEIDVEEVLRPLKKLTYILVIITILFFLMLYYLAPEISLLLSDNQEQKIALERSKNLGLFEGQENERQKISMELHDDIAPCISMLTWKISTYLSNKEHIQDLNNDIQNIQDKVRQLSSKLSLNLLIHHGFYEICNYLFSQIKKKALSRNIDFSASIEDSKDVLKKLDPSLAITIYRFFQETLENAFKHSQAKVIQALIKTTDNQVHAFVYFNC